jgi:hypothetical protein
MTTTLTHTEQWNTTPREPNSHPLAAPTPNHIRTQNSITGSRATSLFVCRRDVCRANGNAIPNACPNCERILVATQVCGIYCAGGCVCACPSAARRAWRSGHAAGDCHARLGMGKKRSYTPRTTPDGATEHIVKSSAAPTVSEKQEIAQGLLQKAQVEHLFEIRDGSCRVKQLAGSLGKYCSSFGECAECSCSLSRLQQDQPRKLFRRTIVEQELGRVPPPRAVRVVSIGCGGLLTDFECLLELWSRGCTIEAFVAIDASYAEYSPGHSDYMESLASLARFFAPDCRVFSFTSSKEYVAAAKSSPERYGQATMFLYCDAGSVEDAHYEDAAVTALLPGCCSYELWNGGASSTRYFLGVLRRRGEAADTEGASASHGDDSGAVGPAAGFSSSLLEEVCNPSYDAQGGRAARRARWDGVRTTALRRTGTQ